MSGALLPEQGDFVADTLKAHAIDYIIDSHCDYSAEVECDCDWRGSAQDYRKHLLVALGLTSRVITEWETELGYRGITRPIKGGADDEEYLNLFRSKKDRVMVPRR